MLGGKTRGKFKADFMGIYLTMLSCWLLSVNMANNKWSLAGNFN